MENKEKSNFNNDLVLLSKKILELKIRKKMGNEFNYNEYKSLKSQISKKCANKPVN